MNSIKNEHNSNRIGNFYSTRQKENGVRLFSQRNKTSWIILFIIFIIQYVSCFQFVENHKMKNLTQNFIKWYTAIFSSQTELMAIHQFNGTIENFQPDVIATAIKELDRFEKRISSIDSSLLSEKQKINYVVVKNKLQLQLLELEHRKVWKNDPYFYTHRLKKAVEKITQRLDDSTQSVEPEILTLLKNIPPFITQSIKNLQGNQLVRATCALTEIEDLQKMFTLQPMNFEDIDSMYLDSVIFYSDVIVDSLTQFQEILINKSKLNEFQGKIFEKSEYETYINALLGEHIQPETLMSRLEVDIEKYNHRLIDHCRNYFSGKNMNVEKEMPRRLVQMFHEEISRSVPRKDEIIPLCRSFDHYMKRFVTEIANLSLSVDYKVHFQWTSTDFLSPGKLLKLQPYNTLRNNSSFYCDIKSLPGDNNWMEQYAVLQDYNFSSLKIALLTDGTPLQLYNWQLNREHFASASVHFFDQPIVRSLPFYLTFKFLKMGFGGYDAKLKFVLLEQYLKICYSAYAELLFYNKDYSDSQLDSLFLAAKIFTENDVSAARQKIHCLPGKDLQIYWTVSQLKAIEHECRLIRGAMFSEREFLQKLILFGPVPVSFIGVKINEFYQIE